MPREDRACHFALERRCQSAVENVLQDRPLLSRELVGSGPIDVGVLQPVLHTLKGDVSGQRRVQLYTRGLNKTLGTPHRRYVRRLAIQRAPALEKSVHLRTASPPRLTRHRLIWLPQRFSDAKRIQAGQSWFPLGVGVGLPLCFLEGRCHSP